jgi:hypothetical protein
MKVSIYDIRKNIKDLLNWEYLHVQGKFEELVSADEAREFAEKIEKIKLEDSKLKEWKGYVANCFEMELFVILAVEELNQLLRASWERKREADSRHFSGKPTYESFAKQLLMKKLPQFPNQL